jgi:prevent-host-death family protein
MKSSLLTLRRSPGKILDAIETGQEVTLTRRNRPIARIIPAEREQPSTVRSQSAFGMWKDLDQESVAVEVRKLRKGRSFDL